MEKAHKRRVQAKSEKPILNKGEVITYAQTASLVCCCHPIALCRV